ncbi:Undecaprenyl pyrophosphate synthase (UppS) (PDB:1X07) [Commensalibacter communis]|uniref:polyprenyl diphosphate synthase n=1 Tax=Commensalibacter communis TaxID=2972786 RepID=UPI0022FF695A|nr:polyprenyl diphosphate synthase [Commensalibacter communis]CAI3947331.1 Undecaprenyl pyrophosphate synthase (UppS) (PDB:1X07) [Commensalibacter communis]CAI3948679.1 Undecaprenyl pyrophosphate synthase (UppS) (PDB:1X07) [Commensalibacter communis]
MACSPLDKTNECLKLSEPKSLPRHVAIIMDGNSRWAEAKSLPRVAGHKEGAQAVKRCIKAAIRNNIPWLTLYAFSSENWRRTPEEVADLTALLRYYIKFEARKLHKEGVCVRIIGDSARFDEKLQREFKAIEQLTENNTRLILTLALSYGGRGEIIQAVQRIASDVQANKISLAQVTEDVFAQYLFAPDIPDPDLIVRTSGECRLSNFLLWQSAYAELVFVQTLWPDFNEEHFNHILNIYVRRDRRFGSRPGLTLSDK